MRHKLVHLTLKKKSKLTEEVREDPGLPEEMRAGARLSLGTAAAPVPGGLGWTVWGATGQIGAPGRGW